MSKLVDDFKEDGLAVLAVNAWDESREVVATYAKDHKLRQTILLNGGDVASNLYKIKGIPTVFWINADGEIRYVEDGFNSPSSLARKTKRLLSCNAE